MLYVICLLIIFLSLYYVLRVCKAYKGPVRWIYFEIIYNCFIKFLIGYLGLPSILNYATDLILIIIIFYYVWLKRKGKNIFIPKNMKIFFGIYLFVTILSFLINIYSPLLYIWGFRNNMRFILFAMMCTVFLEKRDLYSMFDIFFGYFILNIITVTYEFFFAGKSFHNGDSISGLYSMGNISGGNDALNWILCIICTIAIVRYINEKKLGYMLVCVLGSIYIAALSELKVFFMELVLISIVAFFTCKKSTRMFTYFGICIIAVIVGVNVLYYFFPQFDNFFTLETMKAYVGGETGYISRDSINRLNAIPYVFNRFLKSFSERILGVGFGNADYSSFSFLTSSFYLRYRGTAYQWFYGPFILIETGIVGLISFIMILLNYFRQAVKMNVAETKEYSLRCIAIIICILSVIMLFYNQSLKMEASGYMVHMMLCIPYITEKKINLLNNDCSIVKPKVRFKINRIK